jgi:predicted transcriptional regulator
MNDGIFNNGIQQPVQLRQVNGPLDWQAFKAQVALQVIGYYVKIYESRQGNMVTDAQAQAVEAAAELAEKMERRLKQ